jgi:hypothetical protein
MVTGKAWQNVEELERVAQRLQERGLLVVENLEAALPIKASPFQPAPPPLSEVFFLDRSLLHSAASTTQVCAARRPCFIVSAVARCQ